jgi:hypothetical protein
MCEEDKDMTTAEKTEKKARPIPKTQIGMSIKQKDILRSFVGKIPVDLNSVRDWEKYGEN